jgi:hypothetical protein
MFITAFSIGGERHEKETMRRWIERVGRVLPNLHIKCSKAQRSRMPPMFLRIPL